MAKVKITKDMSLVEVIEKKPESAEVMMKFGLHCLGCAAAHFETLEEGCKAHGMSDKDIEKMLKELNKSDSK